MRFPGLATLAAVALCACGGDGGGGGPQAGSIALSAGDNQVAAAGAALPDSLAVIVKDNANAVLPGALVTWSVTAGGGSVSPTTRTSDAAGIAKTRLTLGPNAGTQTAPATVAGLVGSPVTITFQATAGTATNIVKTTGDGGTATPSTQVTYTVTARDANNNPKQGVTIDWAVATGGGSITPPQNTTGPVGTASAQRTLGSGTGAQTATATASGLPGTPQVTFTTTAQLITTITIADNSFTPSTLTVPLHTTVTWSWGGANIHNVTFTAQAGVPADIGNRTSGDVPRTFDAAGTFSYRCTNHGGMTGSVTVNP